VKIPQVPARNAFDRFQTAVAGIRFVPTVIGNRFDPYQEPARKPSQSRQQLEQVARVEIK
jgi:hypothetical protein